MQQGWNEKKQQQTECHWRWTKNPEAPGQPRSMQAPSITWKAQERATLPYILREEGQLLAPDMNTTTNKPKPIVTNAHCRHGLKTLKRHVGAQVLHSQDSAQGTLDQQKDKDRKTEACTQFAHNSALAAKNVTCIRECRDPKCCHSVRRIPIGTEATQL